MIKKALFTSMIFITVISNSYSQSEFVTENQNLAKTYFNEMKEHCLKDNGQLWGKSLCVPMAFINKETREIITNQQDSAGTLEKYGDVYYGSWPNELPIANTSREWNGTRWTTLVWPIPKRKTPRTALMIHEAFHNIQEKIGFPMKVSSNPHLGTRDGRVWIKLEWEALMSALKSNKNDRITKIKDALTFRALRRQLFENASETERQLEMHEGLAEYTGVKLCGLSLKEASYYLADTSFVWRKEVPSLETSFAYISGPAYGLLLDATNTDWVKNLKPSDDLGLLLQSELNISLPENLKAAAEEKMSLYKGSAIVAVEDERELLHKQKLDKYRKMLVDGSILVLPLREMNIQYDPTNIVALDDLGNVYPTITVSDLWGIINVTESAALISPTWTELTVPAPADSKGLVINGDGWKLELNEGWNVIDSERAGDYTLIDSK